MVDQQVWVEALAMFNLEPGADARQVRRAWRELARRLHPDVGGDAETFQQAEAAYVLLQAGLVNGRVPSYQHDEQAAHATETYVPQASSRQGGQADGVVPRMNGFWWLVVVAIGIVQIVVAWLVQAGPNADLGQQFAGGGSALVIGVVAMVGAAAAVWSMQFDRCPTLLRWLTVAAVTVAIVWSSELAWAIVIGGSLLSALVNTLRSGESR